MPSHQSTSVTIREPVSASWEHDNTDSCPSSPSSSCSRTSSLPSDILSSVEVGLTQYPIDQLLFLASSPLVQSERHHVASALGRLGLPEIRKPKAGRPRRSVPKNSTPIAPIPIVRNSAVTGSQTHRRQSPHSPSSTDSGRSSGSWKHSWSEVAALQTWRRV